MPQSVRQHVLSQRRFRLVSLILLIIAVTLGLVIVPIEQGAGNIRTIEDGLWWSATTISGVGYGDLYPVTTIGRVIGAVLQLTGVLTLGTIIAIIGVALNRRHDDIFKLQEIERSHDLEARLSRIEKALQYMIENKK